MHRGTIRILLALALSALTVTNAPAEAASTRKLEPFQLRIGTYNVVSRATLDTFKGVVSQVKPSVDVLGIQEVGLIAKNQWLIGSDRNWGYYRAPASPQNPVIWDRSKLDFVSGHGLRLSTGRKIESRSGHGTEAIKDNWAGVVRLLDRSTGQQLSFINVHLVTGVIKGGRPVPGRKVAFKLYREQLRTAINAVRAERAVSDDVFILGDFNSGYEADVKWKRKQLPVTQFRRIGYRSMWQGSPLLSKRYGTHSDALIDQIWNPAKPVSTEILRNVRGSDHYPAIGTYQLPAPDPTYVAPSGSVGFAAAPPVRNEYTKTTGKFVEIPLQGDLSHGYYAVRVDTARSTAVEGQDFYIDNSSYLPGSRTIYVKINKDSTVEPDETYTLQIVDPVNMTVIPGSESVTGTIEANRS